MKRIVTVERSGDGAVTVRTNGLTDAELSHLTAVLANRAVRCVRSMDADAKGD